MTFISAAKALALLGSTVFTPVFTPVFTSAAAFADAPYFLSDQFAIPPVQVAAPVQKPLFGSPNDHLERIPKCDLYFDYRKPGSERIVVYRYLPAPKALPNPKPHARSQRRK